jgi:hypothetical protein
MADNGRVARGLQAAGTGDPMPPKIRPPGPHPALERAARLTRHCRPDPLWIPLQLNLTRATLLAYALLGLVIAL